MFQVQAGVIWFEEQRPYFPAHDGLGGSGPRRYFFYLNKIATSAMEEEHHELLRALLQ
jgi:hypothetical protein